MWTKLFELLASEHEYSRDVRFIVTSGTTADCTQAKDLIKDTGAKYLLADRGYDTNKIIEAEEAEEAEEAGMEVIIPPRRQEKYCVNIIKMCINCVI